MSKPSRGSGTTARPDNNSPSDFAATYDDGSRELVVAFFGSGEGVNSDPRDLLYTRRFTLTQTTSSLRAAVREWAREVGASDEPAYLFCPLEDFSERTRAFPLEAEERELPLDGLAAVVVAASDGNAVDTQGLPIFDKPVDQVACDIAPLPDGDISLTEAARDALDRTLNRLSNTFASAGEFMDYRVETRLRAALRYWLLVEEARDASEGRGEKLVAFVVVGGKGSSIGLWSASRGLFKEDGENFVFDDAPTPHTSFAASDHIGDVLLGPGEDAAPHVNFEEVRRAALEQAVEFSVGKLARKLTAAKLEEYGFAGVSNVEIVWAASPEVADCVAAQMEALVESRARAAAGDSPALRSCPLRVPLEEAVTNGLLLGPVYPQAIPPINLLTDLRSRAARYKETLQRRDTAAESRSRTAATLAVVAPFVVAVAVVFASYLDVTRAAAQSAARRDAAAREAARLKPLAAARQSYVGTFNWMQSYVQQIIDLRKRQGAAISLYADLDSRFPLADDQTFYVSQVRLDPKGALELKGYTKRKEALTAFVNSMESAGDVYSNVQFDIAEGTQPGAAPPPGVQLPPTAGPSGNTLAPGVITWTITALYKPLADAAAKGAQQQPPPAMASPVPSGQTTSPVVPQPPNPAPGISVPGNSVPGGPTR